MERSRVETQPKSNERLKKFLSEYWTHVVALVLLGTLIADGVVHGEQELMELEEERAQRQETLNTIAPILGKDPEEDLKLIQEEIQKMAEEDYAPYPVTPGDQQY